MGEGRWRSGVVGEECAIPRANSRGEPLAHRSPGITTSGGAGIPGAGTGAGTPAGRLPARVLERLTLRASAPRCGGSQHVPGRRAVRKNWRPSTVASRTVRRYGAQPRGITRNPADAVTTARHYSVVVPPRRRRQPPAQREPNIILLTVRYECAIPPRASRASPRPRLPPPAAVVDLPKPGAQNRVPPGTLRGGETRPRGVGPRPPGPLHGDTQRGAQRTRCGQELLGGERHPPVRPRTTGDPHRRNGHEVPTTENPHHRPGRPGLSSTTTDQPVRDPGTPIPHHRTRLPPWSAMDAAGGVEAEAFAGLTRERRAEHLLALARLAADTTQNSGRPVSAGSRADGTGRSAEQTHLCRSGARCPRCNAVPTGELLALAERCGLKA